MRKQRNNQIYFKFQVVKSFLHGTMKAFFNVSLIIVLLTVIMTPKGTAKNLPTDVTTMTPATGIMFNFNINFN